MPREDINKVLTDSDIRNLITINKFESKKEQLLNLTYLKTYAIDDRNTIEIDDAISIQKKEDKTYIWVHIASVASFNKHNKAIMKIAESNACSLYLSNKNRYMLPEKLIREILSLDSEKNCKCLSTRVELRSDGSIKNSKLFYSLIKLNYKLTYEEADELIDLKPKEEEDLFLLSDQLSKRRNFRISKGATSINQTAIKFKFDNNKLVHKIINETLSRQLVAESMILFGSVISQFCNKNRIPIPYRNQESSKHLDPSLLKKYPKPVQDFLVKKNLRKSNISVAANIHSGLGLKTYCQCTSPIRRYIDLLIHNQVYSFFNGSDIISGDDITSLIDKYNYKLGQIIQIEREDFNDCIKVYFSQNAQRYYKAYFLEWANASKRIAFLHFLDINIDIICKLTCKPNSKTGQIINICLSEISENDGLINFNVI